MAKQRKLSTKKGAYDWVSGVTEHESLFMPAVSSGKKRLDPGFEVIYEYGYLTDIIPRNRAAFNRAIAKKIPADDLKKIDAGLAAYANSSTASNEDLDILKASILRSEGEDVLTHLYEYADDATKQIMPTSYFEDIKDLLAIDASLLIKPESISFYKKKAIQFTLKALKEFHKKLNNELDFEQFEVHRGQGNYRYYEKSLLENKPDGLSVFTGIGMEGSPFFERQLLNSYSINRRVSEHFMVMGNNTRKYIIDTHIFHVLQNVFSSFIVCEHIDDGQYELLCLPNANQLQIRERLNEDFVSEFILDEPNSTFRMPSKDDLLNIRDNMDDLD